MNKRNFFREVPTPVGETTGVRCFQIKTKMNYNFSESTLEFCVSYSVKQYSSVFLTLSHKCEPSSITTKWKATHAGQGISHLLAVGAAAASERDDDWYICSQFQSHSAPSLLKHQVHETWIQMT